MRHRLRQVLAVLTILTALAGGVLYTVLGLGVRTYRVESGSMQPVLPIGAVIVDWRGTPHVNDLVTFRVPGSQTQHAEVVTHVFGGYTKDGHLRTRGVANPTEDHFSPAPTKNDVLGVEQFHIDAFASTFWSSPRGVAVIVLVALLLLVLWTEEKPSPRHVHPVKGCDESASTPV